MNTVPPSMHLKLDTIRVTLDEATAYLQRAHRRGMLYVTYRMSGDVTVRNRIIQGLGDQIQPVHPTPEFNASVVLLCRCLWR